MPEIRPQAPIPREAVEAIVARHFGAAGPKVSRESGGLTNHVFKIRHKRQDFILRVNANARKLNFFLKEQWAAPLAREAGVPVPEILEVGKEPLPYVLLRKLPGEPAIDHPKRCQILEELGSYAARINSVRTPGFGGLFDRKHKQIAARADWNEFLRDEYKIEDRIETLARHRILEPEKLEKIGAIIRAAGCNPRQSALNHGDLRLKNVLVDSATRISAILDWENCSSNLAPEWELSLALHDLSIDEKHSFLDGYALSPKAFSDMAPVIKAFNLLNYSSKIQRLVGKRDVVQLQHYRMRLSGALDLYSI